MINASSGVGVPTTPARVVLLAEEESQLQVTRIPVTIYTKQLKTSHVSQLVNKPYTICDTGVSNLLYVNQTDISRHWAEQYPSTFLSQLHFSNGKFSESES